jgi:hypothetical protein
MHRKYSDTWRLKNTMKKDNWVIKEMGGIKNQNTILLDLLGYNNGSAKK